jgi:hypothetical protein
MDKTKTNNIPSSLNNVKGTLEPKTKKPDKIPEDQTDHVEAIEKIGGSLTTKRKKLKHFKLNFGYTIYI